MDALKEATRRANAELNEMLRHRPLPDAETTTGRVSCTPSHGHLELRMHAEARWQAEGLALLEDIIDDPDGRSRVLDDRELGQVLSWAAVNPIEAERVARKLLAK